MSLNDKSRWRQATAAVSVLQQRRARLQLPQVPLPAFFFLQSLLHKTSNLVPDRYRQVITGDFNAEASSPTLQPFRESMVDMWAASVFANASVTEGGSSKALRAARAHAWGGDCPLTHPSLTFPTWVPVKRIDMM
jgi:endonuclease/exonuclease/phosphatase family metal-dependent hydrolase